MPRSSLAGPVVPPGVSAVSGATFGSVLPGHVSHYQQQHHQQLLVETLSSLGFPYNDSALKSAAFPQDRRLCNSGTASVLRDHGLLQDIVPSHMLKEE